MSPGNKDWLVKENLPGKNFLVWTTLNGWTYWDTVWVYWNHTYTSRGFYNEIQFSSCLSINFETTEIENRFVWKQFWAGESSNQKHLSDSIFRRLGSYICICRIGNFQGCHLVPVPTFVWSLCRIADQSPTVLFTPGQMAESPNVNFFRILTFQDSASYSRSEVFRGSESEPPFLPPHFHL